MKDPLIGPIFIFCAILLGMQQSVNFDWLPVGIIGLILCAKIHFRGLIYSLLLLLVESMIKHTFFIDRHLWQFGLEASLAMSFGLTAAVADMMRREEAQLTEKIETQAKTVCNLEEELAKSRQDAQDEQIHLRDRIATLQKECDEALSELSSYQILNDVLRKNATQITQERDERAVKIQALIGDIEEKKKEVAQLHAMHLSEQKKEQQIIEQSQAISFMQERLQALSQIEVRYLELKKQFEEKNQILHETRVQLFHADTMVQANQLRQEQNLEPAFAEKSLTNDLVTLENERLELEQENHELINLVQNLLNEKPPAEIIKTLTKTVAKPKRKKKEAPPEEQTILF